MDASIYAFDPKSAGQRRYSQERIATLAEARKRRATGQDTDEPLALERTTSNISMSAKNPRSYHSRDNSNSEINHVKVPATSSSNSSAETAHQSLLSSPYEVRYDRRYLRDVPYPLPVDLQEIQRQNLRTLLSCKVFGTAICSPNVRKEIPQRVLEIACGSGYWSATCHDYFCSLGHDNVSFTGLDIAPLPPDLRKQGVHWNFVQHDLRRVPLPFDDEEFDLVMLKDVSLVVPTGPPSQRLIDESIRILAEGGTLEIWDSDHVVRSLVPHPSVLSRQHAEQKTAIETATFLTSAATPFAPAQNKFLVRANAWIQEALDKRKLPSTPCATIADALHQEVRNLENVGSRRIAIPLGDLRWERDGSKHSQYPSDKQDGALSKGKEKMSEKALTDDQAALRQTALLTFLQTIESLEPCLKEVNGKNSEEWAGWWASMMSQLLDPSKGALIGECLEIGAWWATKITKY